MTKKITISIPDELHQMLSEFRGYINISNVCAESLKMKMDQIEGCVRQAKKRFEILITSEACKLAYEDGMNWAGYHANPVELAIVCNWTNGWLSNDPQAQETIDLLEENNEKINKILSGYTTGYEYIFSESFISRGIVSYPIDYDDVDIVKIAVAFSQGAQIIWNRVKNKLIPKLINSND